MIMEQINTIIVFACAAFAAGIWQAGIYSWHSLTLIVLAMLLFLTALWRVVRNYQQAFWPIIGLFFIAGMLCANLDSIVPADDISHHIGKTVTVTGIVDAVPEISQANTHGKQVRYVVRVQNVELEKTGAKSASGGKVRINVLYKENGELAVFYGDKITVYGKVRELRGYNNPGQIDMTVALKREGITARMSVQEQNIKLNTAYAGYSWRAALADWQAGIVRALQKVMPVNDAAILTAVLFGGYQGINKSVVDDFAATGLIHILSVSGAHIALVAGLIRWFGNQLRLGSRTTTVVAVLAIVFYACISGFTPPVIRSMIMGIISLLAILVERESYAPAALAITALGMLVYQPLLLYDISFQLSFAATAGLVFLYKPTYDYLSAFLPAWLAGPLAVTASAQLGVLPIIAWYFNNFSLISFAANILVLPVVELVIILGLTGVIIYTVVPVIGNLVFVISSLLIGLVMMLTAFLAAVPYSSVYIPSVGISGSAAYYLLLAWFYGWRPLAVPGPGQLVRQRPGTCATTAIVIIGLLAVYTWYPRPLSVHFIDVGQGDAALIITPRGKTVLVDTGGSFSSSNYDIGERVVAPYLKHYGVTTVDYLILTHGHQDHAGGAAGIAGRVSVNKVMLPREEYSQAVQALVHTKPAIAIIPTYTDQRFQLDGVDVGIEHAVGENGRNQAVTGNEVSSVVRVSYGRHSFLITGDLEAKGEEALLAAKEVKPCTVLKVGHHGSKTSTTAAFLQALAPEYAVISVGYANRFGHPHPETIRRLTDRQTVIYRTDTHGAVVFKSDGRKLEVDTYIK